MQVRMCNLQAGDVFQIMTTVYMVRRIVDGVIYYGHHSPKKSIRANTGRLFSVGANCQQWVIKIGHYQLKSRQVLRFDLYGNLIDSFYSVADAAERTGLKLHNICHALRGRSKTCGGYIWKRIA